MDDRSCPWHNEETFKVFDQIIRFVLEYSGSELTFAYRTADMTDLETHFLNIYSKYNIKI